VDRLTNANPAADDPNDLNALIREVNSLHDGDRLYVTLLLPSAQAVVDGHTLPAVPLSMANVLDPLRASRGMALNGESAVPVTSIPLEAKLSGQQVVSLNVE
jgi:hypothetical protein